jgi:putative transposase
MPRNARCVESELVYHVTQRGVNRQDVFFSHADRTTYLALAEANTADCQVRVFAWCLMSNHVHWVLEAGRANSLAVFFRRVNGRYAQYLNARRRRTGHLWQNRFFSCPVGPTHLWHTLRYVEGNPVRAGLMEVNEAYRGRVLGRMAKDRRWRSDAFCIGGSGARRAKRKVGGTSWA